ncbi:response regulator (plasmid) [Sinorhizobium medicae]|uniref:response regulator transcription factor n=1 Tax=Sinorhizobium medicae TaxID=110321 RepID=UPI002AF6BC65|nr:response regulator [Sinorhizobium medicae]WQO68666.1 response regulator [Sinorhizobium medicae]WQO75685.1 response regulator [Sinorhizobium medicae]
MHSLSHITVAIVDDDQFLLESLHDFFDAMSIPSKTYRSAEEFLKSGDAQWVHCVLADFKMPGISGLQLLETLVREGGPPVCIMTSFADDRTRAAVHSGGAVGLLEKPISSANLLNFISASKRKVTGVLPPRYPPSPDQ